MAESNTESQQPRQYRRHESMKEYRQVKANEKQQKLEKSAEREGKRQEAIKAISKDKPDVAERIDLENLADANIRPESTVDATESQAAIEDGQGQEQVRIGIQAESDQLLADSVRVSENNHAGSPGDAGEVVKQEFKLGRNERSNGDDKWLGAGELNVEGDFLSYSRVNRKPENPYKPGSRDHSNFEEYLAKNYSPRGIELGLVDKQQSVEAGHEVKIPSAMLWKIIETNPEELDTKVDFNLLNIRRPVRKWKGITLESADYAVKTLKPLERQVKNSDGIVKTVEVNHSWKKLTVDKKTLTAIQQKAIEYIEQQVKLGNMPTDILETAKGILDSHNAPRTVNYAPFKKQSGGETAETPREHSAFLQRVMPESWNKNGSLERIGGNIIYENDKLRQRKDARTLQIATIDTGNEMGAVLTQQAWDILKTVPKDFEDKSGTKYLLEGSDALTNPTLDRQGVWKRFVKPFVADLDTLVRTQTLIKDFVFESVEAGKMDRRVLATVNGLLKYKYPTLEPTRIDSMGRATYAMAKSQAA